MEIKFKKSEETKQKIVKSGEKLFRSKGFEATSVREIVEDVGCAKGTFYLYFETKLHLLYYITNEVFNNFSELIALELSHLEDDPFGQLERLISNVVAHMEIQEGPLRFIHTYEMLSIIQEEPTEISFIDTLIVQITEFLNKGIQKGVFRKVNAEIYGRIIFSMAHDLLESAMLTQFPGDIHIVKDELMVIIRKILEK